LVENQGISASGFPFWKTIGGHHRHWSLFQTNLCMMASESFQKLLATKDGVWRFSLLRILWPSVVLEVMQLLGRLFHASSSSVAVMIDLVQRACACWGA